MTEGVYDINTGNKVDDIENDIDILLNWPSTK